MARADDTLQPQGSVAVYNPSNAATYNSSRDGPDSSGGRPSPSNFYSAPKSSSNIHESDTNSDCDRYGSSAGVGGPHSGIGGGHLDSGSQRLFADYTSDHSAGADRFTDLYSEGTGGYGYDRRNLNQVQQNSRVQARSRLQSGKTASDDESESELDDGLDEIAKVAERLRAIAIAKRKELERQNEPLDRITKDIDTELAEKVKLAELRRAKAQANADELDRQQERLERIEGSTADTELADRVKRAEERLNRS